MGASAHSKTCGIVFVGHFRRDHAQVVGEAAREVESVEPRTYDAPLSGRAHTTADVHVPDWLKTGSTAHT